MRKATAIILITMLYYGCKKPTTSQPQQNIFIDVPFELKYRTEACLIDGNKTLSINFVKIQDYRSTGAECMTTTGGIANIYATIQLNSGGIDTCGLSMPGCTNGGEYDSTNVNTPQCTFDIYKILLLKLTPHDNIPASINNYSIKYVIKKI